MVKRKDNNDAVEIGIEEGGLYKLKGHADSALATSTINPCELWHIRLAHVHYKSLPIVSKVVTGLPEIQIEILRIPIQKVTTKQKGS